MQTNKQQQARNNNSKTTTTSPRTLEVVDRVDALLVALEREVGRRLADRPDLDRAVERGRRKGVGVLGVEHDLFLVLFALVWCLGCVLGCG